MSNVEAITSPVPVERGGTGATNAASALNSLGGLAKKTVYYPSSSGTNLVDTVLDGTFLIAASESNNASLYAAIKDTFVYITQIFYNETNRMQLAVGYTNGKIASRTNKDGIWSNWVIAANTSQPMTFSVNSSGGLRVTY